MTDLNKDGVIHVFIVDDHAIVRDGIRALLATEPGIDVVGEAGNGRDAISGVQRLQPDVILMDLVMPEIDGIEAIRRIINHQPGARILVLTSFAADDKLFPAINAGARGYLLKDSESQDVIQAIRQVYRGESSLHPKITRRVLKELSSPSRPSTALELVSNSSVKTPDEPQVDPLTERELSVLRFLAAGLSYREIAEELYISINTVKAHAKNIYSKLGVHGRMQAAQKAKELSLL